LYIEDDKRIDVVLAVALSSKIEGIPLWLIIVGASGDMKSAQLNAIRNEDTYLLHNLTSKTLVNGYKDKLKFPDLAPELDGKIVIIPDMAQILKLPPVEKGELWGQLRDLYDGYAGKTSGQGGRSKYEGLKVTILAGSTPAIDGQILVHQDLGTRELIYRTEGNVNKRKVMKKCFENEEKEDKISKELREVTRKFLASREPKRDYITEEIEDKIMEISSYITYMRATAEIDSYSNELRNDVYPEEPTRIAKQMKRLYVCLMSLADDYPEERALEIMWKVAKSSAFPIRIKIFDVMLENNEEFSTSKIAEMIKIGKSTAQRELGILWSMGLVKLRREATSYPDRFYDYWSINLRNKFVMKLREEKLGINRPKI
jgi:predicted transcriptional regulator